MPLVQEPRVVKIDHGGKLHVAVGNDVVIRLPQHEGDYKATLVGMHPFEFVILKLPPVPGLKETFSKGSGVIVRYLYRGVVYGFNSQVLSLASQPCFLLYLAYPDSYETLSLRKSLRIQCLVPCKVYTEQREHNGYIVDLGLGGCRVNFEAKEAGELVERAVGKDVYVEFTLCGSKELFVVKCLLRHVLEGEGKYSFGIEFSGISPRQQAYLTEYILKISRAC